MKKQFLLLTLIFLLIKTAFSQDWVQQESNTSSNLQDLFFITRDKGFVVGTSGTLLQTTNGGLDWSSIPINTSNHLRSIYFTDSLVGFLTSDSELFKTANGGQTWFSQDSINRGIIRFVDKDTGFVFGPQEILATVDGGLTWISRNPSYSSIHYDGAMAVDSKTFFMWGAYGRVDKSIDNGFTWQFVYGNSVEKLNDMFFVNDSTGYFVGGGMSSFNTSGLIRKTTNIGENWNSCSPSNASCKYLQSVYFINEKLGFVVGDEGNIEKTTDAGNSWVKLNSPTYHTLTKVSFLDSLTGYIVGSNGTILKMTNGGGSKISIPSTMLQSKIVPNPFSNKITINLENDDNLNTQVYVYNLNGNIVHYASSSHNNLTLDLEKLKSGVYFVKIFNDKNSVFSKIIKL